MGLNKTGITPKIGVTDSEIIEYEAGDTKANR